MRNVLLQVPILFFTMGFCGLVHSIFDDVTQLFIIAWIIYKYRHIRKFPISRTVHTSIRSGETTTVGSEERCYSALSRTLMCYPSGAVLSPWLIAYRHSTEIQTQACHNGLLHIDSLLTRKINCQQCRNVFSVYF